MRRLSFGIEALDELIGGVRERSLILIHESDPRSLGKLLALSIMREKLESDNLVGYFNLGFPVNILLRILEKSGIDWRRHLSENRLMIIDTFGSIYDMKIEMENVWYLKKPISLDTLNEKYIEVIRDHKERWKELGMFEGRELWGITISMSDYLNIFTPEATQRYLEVADIYRGSSDVYRKYPAGTNVWIYSGNDTLVLPLVYRKADYVLKTESRIEGNSLKRYLRVVKHPKLTEMPEVEYHIKGNSIVFE